MSTITVTSVAVRPSTDVDFFNMTDAEKEHRHNTYVKTGKILFGKATLSEDQLTRTLVMVFINNDARTEYKNDPVLQGFRNRRNQYYADNNISYDMSFETE